MHPKAPKYMDCFVSSKKSLRDISRLIDLVCKTDVDLGPFFLYAPMQWQAGIVKLFNNFKRQMVSKVQKLQFKLEIGTVALLSFVFM